MQPQKNLGETMRIGRLAALVAVIALLFAPQAGAQNYPERPVRIVVPIGTGGSYDFVARLLAEQLSKRLGQNVIVENITGAGTIVGTRTVAQAAPDGYTLLIGGLSNIVFNAGLYKKLPYDPQADFVPVAMVNKISYILVGNKDLPYSTAKELVEAAKKNPDGIKVAHAGLGTGQHLVGAAFMRYADIKMLEVAYRGSSALYPDLLAGRVDLYFDSAASAMPYLKAGQIKGIATLTAARNPQVPNVPTMTESGIAGLEIDSWIGLFAPAKTPPAIVARLQKEIAEILPALKPRFEASGGDIMVMAADRLPGFMKSEHEKWMKVIREAGIQLD
jgi:tripartite-type tricarboxylate transporter receptor subunit TctC